MTAIHYDHRRHHGLRDMIDDADDSGGSDAAPEQGPSRSRHRGLWYRTVHGVGSMLTGMGITIRKFFDVGGVVTQQYPENREHVPLAERFRGRVVMPHDEAGEHKCTGCTICEKACPNGSISVLNTTAVTGKKVLGTYIYRYDQCTICSLCVEACPYDAIRMGKDFEGATVDKDSLVQVLNMKEGRS